MIERGIKKLGWIGCAIGITITTFSIVYAQGALQLPRTGQKSCYEPSGMAMDCKGTGQDGESLSGVPWPEPRFTNPDGSAPINSPMVLDQLTGLMWARDAGTPTVASCTGGGKEWPKAMEYINCLNRNSYLGHSDWRLPNINEIESLFNADAPIPADWLKAQGFIRVNPNSYWTSTASHGSSEDVWVAFLLNGIVSITHKWNYYYSVWPVRSWATSGRPAPLWKTGQTHTTVGGDDGDLKIGLPWPDPRFTDQGNGTLADRLTGLIWTKEANAPETGSCRLSNTWQGAIDYMACLNSHQYLGYTDWRLPNRKELLSLVNHCPDSALPPDLPFSKAISKRYWSSTTFANAPDNAWVVAIGGTAAAAAKASSPGVRVWPVRGGTVSPPIVDLTGEWTSLTQSCKGVKWWKTCALQGAFHLQNAGNQNASSAILQFYLSDTKEGDGKGTLLKQVSTGDLNAGEVKAENLYYPLQKGKTATGMYVIAVIDADNTIAEADKKNNRVVFGPIP
jgi:hypothetical protein